jgi:hypothetical protein
MNGGSKIVVAGLIMIGGVVAALPFQRVPEPAGKKIPPSKPDIELRSHDIVHQQRVGSGTTPALSLYEEGEESKGNNGTVASFHPPRLVPLPSMDPTYKPLIDIEWQAEPQAAQTRKVDLPVLPQPDRHVNTDEDSEDAARDLRQHEIVDGDSLESIAQRYLDDSTRALEVFNWNLEVLSDPQLLPIGKKLRIPPRTRAKTPRTPNPSEAGPGQAGNIGKSEDKRTKMVPLPKF